MTTLDERSKNDLQNALNMHWRKYAWSLIDETCGVAARDRLWHELCRRLSGSLVGGGTFSVVRQSLAEEESA